MVKDIISGEVTDLSKLRKTIAALRENMELEINSPGGSVIEGLQTINLIQKSPYKITATVEVMACSIAAVIALSCDKIKIKSTDIMVLHNSMTITMGNKEQLQQLLIAFYMTISLLNARSRMNSLLNLKQARMCG